MDTPEKEPKEPAKHTRVRLASPRRQLEHTIQKMTKLSETPMKAEKLVDHLKTLSEIQVKLLDMDRDGKQNALIEENERLKSELAAEKNQSDDERQRLREQMDSERLRNFSEVEALKLQNATLQAKNAELSTNNSELKSVNSELAEKVQSLQMENGERQLTIMRLQTRTPRELLDEATAKMSGTSFETS
jgi:hypothetical protein